MPRTLNCPACGAPLDVRGDEPTLRCPFCNTTIIVPPEILKQTGTISTTDALKPTIAESVNREAALEKIVELARSGKKIVAIKEYRTVFGGGLKEAKDAVEALEQGKPVDIPLEVVGAPAQRAPDDLEGKIEKLTEIVSIAQSGQKIQAIKMYRELFDVSLKEAKDAIEGLMEGKLIVAFVAMKDGRVAPPVRARAAVPVAAGAAGASCFGLALPTFIIALVLIPVLFALTLPGGPLELAWAKTNPWSPARVVLDFGAEGSGPGSFLDPREIAVDGDGNIYVGGFNDGRIQKFSSTGKLLSVWLNAEKPTLSGLAADRNGNVYAVWSGKIFRYDGSTGKITGRVEDVTTQFNFDDVAVTADGGLVTIAGREDIVHFDADGSLKLVIPDAISSISGDSELDVRVAVDGLGNIYALGTFNKAVFKFGPDGKFITRFGSYGEEPGQFRGPNAIAVDNKGKVYVSDIFGIQTFDGNGRYLDRIQVKNVAFGMAFNDQNELLVVTNTPLVLKLSLKE